MKSITPILRYDDAHAALDFLERAFGLERLAVHEHDEGKVGHAELRSGDAVVGLYVVVDDVDPLYERAKAAGAEIIMEPVDQDYGSRDFSVRDPEGNLWAFGTYALGG
jgi:uncharacterized glyoxalase superfamily protein PhnB